MADKKNNNKTEFIHFVMAIIEHDSSSDENATEYLTSEGYDVESLVLEGLKEIKKIQLKIQAEKIEC